MFIFFFKQKTAYEMRISDWSSDVCSSDLPSAPRNDGAKFAGPPRRPHDGLCPQPARTRSDQARPCFHARPYPAGRRGPVARADGGAPWRGLDAMAGVTAGRDAEGESER